MTGRGAIALLIGVMLALGAFAGCGGDDETSSVTRAQFIKQADAICAEAAKNKENAVAKAFNSRSLKELPKDKKVQEELVLEVLVPLEQMTEELAELDAPDGDEEKVEKMVASYESAVKGLKENPSEGLSESYDAFGKATGEAAAYGLQVCRNVR